MPLSPEQSATMQAIIRTAFNQHRRLGVEPEWRHAPPGTIGAVINEKRGWHLFAEAFEDRRIGKLPCIVVLVGGVTLHFTVENCRWEPSPHAE